MVAQAKAVRPNVVNGINVDDLFALDLPCFFGPRLA
jgi:hypothetical protein